MPVPDVDLSCARMWPACALLMMGKEKTVCVCIIRALLMVVVRARALVQFHRLP